MTVRRAVMADMPLLVTMGEAFHDAAKLPFPYSPEAVQAALASMMQNGCVLVSDKGCIGGILGNAWSNPAWVYACELFWWAEDGKGRDLLRAFEDWARDNGANEVRMTSLHHLKAAEVVLWRHHYETREMSYGKVI